MFSAELHVALSDAQTATVKALAAHRSAAARLRSAQVDFRKTESAWLASQSAESEASERWASALLAEPETPLSLPIPGFQAVRVQP